MNNIKNQQIVLNKSKKHSLQKKRLIIIFVVFIILLCGIVGGCLFMNFKKSTVHQDVKIIDETNQIVTEAQSQLYDGDVDAAIATYDNAINKTTDLQQKNSLLLGKASAYFNDSRHDDALAIALDLEKINLTDSILFFIAQVYEDKGDNQKAIEYYKKAIPLVDTSGPMGDYYARYYGEKIDELNGTK